MQDATYLHFFHVWGEVGMAAPEEQRYALGHKDSFGSCRSEQYWSKDTHQEAPATHTGAWAKTGPWGWWQEAGFRI